MCLHCFPSIKKKLNELFLKKEQMSSNYYNLAPVAASGQEACFVWSLVFKIYELVNI